VGGLKLSNSLVEICFLIFPEDIISLPYCKYAKIMQNLYMNTDKKILHKFQTLALSLPTDCNQVL
jgi:hypothetical protein